MPRTPSIPDLIDVITDLKRRLSALEQSNPLESAVIGKGGIRTQNFDGTSFANPGTAGNYFGADGVALNNLYLRPGSVGNDALTNPLTAKFYEGSSSGTLTVAGSYLHTGTILVPAGFTQAIVTCTITIGGTNSTGGPDNIYGGPTINTTNGQTIANGAAAGYAQSVTMSQAATITGLAPGSSILVKAWGAVDATGWTGGNGHVSALLLFLR